MKATIVTVFGDAQHFHPKIQTKWVAEETYHSCITHLVTVRMKGRPGFDREVQSCVCDMRHFDEGWLSSIYTYSDTSWVLEY